MRTPRLALLSLSLGVILAVSTANANVYSYVANFINQSAVMSGPATAGTIVQNTISGADNKSITICGAGSTAATRGACASIYGKEASPSGSMVLQTGSVASAYIGTFLQDVTQAAGQSQSVQDANFGARWDFRIKTSSTAALSGATGTIANFIPAGVIADGVVCRVTTLITGATSWSVGDGTTAALWGGAKAVTANTTTTSADFASTWAPKFYSAAQTITFTAAGSNFTAGVIRCSVFYRDMTGPTG